MFPTSFDTLTEATEATKATKATKASDPLNTLIRERILMLEYEYDIFEQVADHVLFILLQHTRSVVRAVEVRHRPPG